MLRARGTYRRSPSADPRDAAESLLEREVVDLDDDAVDLVVELVAPLFPLSAKRDHVVDRRGPRERCGLIGKPSAADSASNSHWVAIGVAVAPGRSLIGKKREPPLRPSAPDRAGARRPTRRCADWRTPAGRRSRARALSRFEIALAQIDFAAHFDERRNGCSFVTAQS